MRVRLLGLVAVLGLVLASCGGATPQASGPSEGIQVHGDWTIDVYNEDGSLEQSVAYSNDLMSSGGSLLVELLEGSATKPGNWQIWIDSPNNGEALEPCVHPDDPQQQPFTCIMDANTEFFPNEARFTLDGSFVADIDGFLVDARTEVMNCETGCTDQGFTQSPIPLDGNGATVKVTQGQIVQVQVEISFTSG